MTDRVEKPLQKYSENWQGKDNITEVTFDGYKNKLKGGNAFYFCVAVRVL